MESQQKRVWFNPFYQGLDRDRLTAGSFLKRLLGMVIGATGFTASLTLIYHAMRGIMRLGGFVASGGPYHIAHQAPDWVWIFPVSFFGGVVFMLFNQVNARRIGGLNLIIWLFPALFISLGYNFLEFAFNPPGQQQEIAWGWLVCGAIFMLMGGLPFLAIVKNIFIILGQESQPLHPAMSARLYADEPGTGNYISRKVVLAASLILNMASIAGGIYLGINIFKTISS